jgi:hypothetical protein
MLAVTLVVALAAIPELADHFPDAGSPTHVFLLVDGASGEVIRAEGPASAAESRAPLGDVERFLVALAGLEDGILADRVVACDSSCWAVAGHGEVTLLEGLAWGCDTWFAAAQAAVSSEAWRSRARSLGLSADGDAVAGVQECASFWRRLERDELGLRPGTTTALLGAAGTAVSSPRGIARALHDPRHRTRAIAVAAGESAWVLGSREILGRPWVFALHLPRGTPPLAAARAAQLLEETRRIARRSTSERGGSPTKEPE